jgi:hypothetical protein
MGLENADGQKKLCGKIEFDGTKMKILNNHKFVSFWCDSEMMAM